MTLLVAQFLDIFGRQTYVRILKKAKVCSKSLLPGVEQTCCQHTVKHSLFLYISVICNNEVLTATSVSLVLLCPCQRKGKKTRFDKE